MLYRLIGKSNRGSGGGYVGRVVGVAAGQQIDTHSERGNQARKCIKNCLCGVAIKRSYFVE
jgi:hypothetical protein